MSKIGSRHAIVVGGGIAGLTAAYTFASQNYRVTLIESSSNFGGLLNTGCDSAGLYYDNGTHIFTKTEEPAVDEFLFPTCDEQFWLKFNQQHVGSYHGSIWDLESQLLNVATLPNSTAKQCRDEYLQKNQYFNSDNIHDYFVDNFGETLTKKLIQPVIEKLYGQTVSLSELISPTSPYRYFGLHRVRMFDKEMTNKLKQEKIHDVKLGYHSRYDMSEHRPDLYFQQVNLYPNEAEGSTAWIARLCARLEAMGVVMLPSSQVTKITHVAGNINQVTVNDVNLYQCDVLYWSAPPVFACKAAGIEFASSPPSYRSIVLLHMSLSKPVRDQNSHYLYVWSPEFHSHRITLYDNFSASTHNKVTIEVLCDPSDVNQFTLENGLDELLKLGLCDRDTRIISGKVDVIRAAVPIPTHGLKEGVESQVKVLAKNLNNFCVSRRYREEERGQNYAVVSAYHDVLALVDNISR